MTNEYGYLFAAVIGMKALKDFSAIGRNNMYISRIYNHPSMIRVMSPNNIWIPRLFYSTIIILQELYNIKTGNWKRCQL